MIKAIIFDCFGVVLTDGFDEAYRSAGGDPDKDRDFIIRTHQASNSGKIPSSIPVFAEHLGLTETAWYEVVNKDRTINHALLDYAKELRGKYKVAMLSNIGQAGVKRFFEPGFIEQYFELIVESGAIGYAKPEAGAYEYVADKLGVRYDECVMIDDRPEYVEGAEAVGMKGVLYQDLKRLKTELDLLLAA